MIDMMTLAIAYAVGGILSGFCIVCLFVLYRRAMHGSPVVRGETFNPTDLKYDDPNDPRMINPEYVYTVSLPEGFWIGRLDQRLGEFTNAMWAKFWKRHEKQHARGTKSVCDPDFDWEHDLDLEELESHLKEELREWLEDGADRVDESVDVANMMFLAWMAERIRETQKARRSQDGQD